MNSEKSHASSCVEWTIPFEKMLDFFQEIFFVVVGAMLVEEIFKRTFHVCLKRRKLRKKLLSACVELVEEVSSLLRNEEVVVGHDFLQGRKPGIIGRAFLSKESKSLLRGFFVEAQMVFVVGVIRGNELVDEFPAFT